MVPYLNRARRRTYARAPEFDPQAVPAGYRFYQYQEDIGDFNEQLAGAGFEILEVIPVQLFEGLTSDWRLGRWLEKRHFFSWKAQPGAQAPVRPPPRRAAVGVFAYAVVCVCEARLIPPALQPNLWVCKLIRPRLAELHRAGLELWDERLRVERIDGQQVGSRLSEVERYEDQPN